MLPSFAIFRSSLGDFCFFLRIFASIPWLRLWCSLFCSVCLFYAYLYPTVASLVSFSCGPPSLVAPVCVCGVSFFLWRWSCVFFLSSCWVWGRLLLSLFWCGCCAFSCGTCSFPQRVLQMVTLLGFRTYLALVGWPTPAVAVYCGVGGVLVHHLVFYLVPAQLPFRCFPLASSAPFLAPVRWSTPAVEPCCWVGGVLIHHLVFYLVPAQLPRPLLTLSGCCNLSGSSLLVYYCGGALLLGWGCLLRHLVFYHVPCSSSRACSLRSLPCSRFPWGFSGHRVSVLLLPW